MRMGIGLGIGINRSNYAQGIFSAYQSRVVADGGVTEAGACVDAVSGLLQTASLLLIPSGYKSGKAYAEIPTNGNGDLTWTRASTAVRTNSSGLLESMGSGVPRLSYMYGSCPALLLEPQRTNSIRNSTMVGAVTGSPGTLPTNYGEVLQGLSREIVGIGTENGLSYIDFKISGTATGTIASLRYEGGTNIAASNGQNWSQSVYLKVISGTVNAVRSAIIERTSVGSYVDERVSSDFSLSTTLNRYTYTATLSGGVTTAYIQPSLYFTLTIGQSYNFTIRIAQPQCELGSYATTPIPTTTASATRIADSFSRNNIYTNGLITSSGGTWFVELRGNLSLTRDAFSNGLRISDSSSTVNNGFEIRNGATIPLIITKRIAGASTTLIGTVTSRTKLAIKWNGSTCDVFLNGVKEVAGSSFTTTNMEFLIGGAEDVPKFIQAMALYPTPLSDTDCTTITTL